MTTPNPATAALLSHPLRGSLVAMTELLKAARLVESNLRYFDFPQPDLDAARAVLLNIALLCDEEVLGLMVADLVGLQT